MYVVSPISLLHLLCPFAIISSSYSHPIPFTHFLNLLLLLHVFYAIAIHVCYNILCNRFLLTILKLHGLLYGHSSGVFSFSVAFFFLSVFSLYLFHILYPFTGLIDTEMTAIVNKIYFTYSP